jgi:hypothetical protein
MYLKNDYFVYQDPNDSRDRVIAGSQVDLSGYSNGELFMHEFGDGTRDLVWIDGSGTARHISEFAVSPYDASGHADNSIWVDSSSSALAWKVGGTGYQCKGDINDVGNIHNLTLTNAENGIKVEWDTQVKRFLPQEWRLYRSDEGAVDPNNDLGSIGNGHVDDTVVDGGTYTYKVVEETTDISGEVQISETGTAQATWSEPYPGNPPTDAPTNVSISFGGTLEGPYPVEVFWDNTLSDYNTQIDIEQRDSFGGTWRYLDSGTVDAGQGSSFSTEPATYTSSELGYRVRATVYYTHPDGDGPTASSTTTAP